MTDLEKLISIIEGHIKYDVVNDRRKYYPEFDEDITIVDVQNSDPGFGDMKYKLGYWGFVSTWIFNKDGKFLAVGHYE